MSYIHNCIHKFSPSEEYKKSVFEKYNHVSIDGKKISKLNVALAMNQMSGFWAFHNLKPFIHSVSKVSTLGLVLSVAIAVGSFSSLTQAADDNVKKTVTWDNATFEATGTGSAEIYAATLPSNPIRGNGFKGMFLYGNTLGSGLDVVVSGGSNIANNSNNNQVYIMGNFQAVTAGSESWSSLVVTPDNRSSILTKDYSSTNSHGSLNLTLNANAKFYAVLYGGRNDLVGTDTKDLANVGDSCNNSLTITLKKGAILGATLLFGGRSGQAEGITNSEGKNPFNVSLKKGYLTDKNEIIIKGEEGETDINLNFPAGGIFGAEGWQTNNNYVSLTNAIIRATSINSRKFGIVGGRGLYNFRIYAGEDSAIANNNILLIQKSKIATDEESLKAEGGNAGMSVLGGYSYGTAKNNITVIEESEINGHVYGGLELLGVTRLQEGAERRKLNANLVSLHNVKLIGDSVIYGTATADSQTYAESGNKISAGVASSEAVDENTLKAVNRRRGIAYIAGSVQAASAHVRFIHFGQSVDVENLKKFESYNIVNSYYPSIGIQDLEDKTRNFVPVTSASGLESNRIGQLVGGSYLNSTKGFHSSLSQQDANQSNSTNFLHNFWVAAYSNLSDQLNGDGINLNTKVALFKAPMEGSTISNEVNHEYSGGDLSLLALDDGMILGGDSGDLMDRFRDSYQGRVLYLGVNNGYDFNGQKIRSVAVDFKQIETFREKNKQNVNAFGNTQIGVFINGNGVGGTSQPYTKSPTPIGEERSWEGMTFTVPGFEITQNNQKVAIATVGFYKYLHFDGKMTDNDGVKVPYYDETKVENKGFETIHGKVTEEGSEGGVGLKYWVESINITGDSLILYGKTENSVLADNKENPDVYTLSAYLTGSGGITIPENSTVIIGDERQPALAVDISGENGIPQQNIGENTFVGETFIATGATLKQGTDGALGSKQHYTRNLLLAGEKTAYELQGHEQTVGGLDIQKGALASLSSKDNGAPGKGGHLTVNGNATVEGNLEGNAQARLTIYRGNAVINSDNQEFHGDLELNNAIGRLDNQNSLVQARAVISATSSLYFNSAQPAIASENTGIATLALTREADPRSAAYIRGIQNAGEVFLSGGEGKVSNLNHVEIAENYAGENGSVIHYRGLVQGPNNSYVDVVHSATASGTSKVSFGDDHSKIPVSGIFAEARGEKTLKSEGIPIFVIADKGEGENQLKLEMQPFGVVAKDNEAYKWIYHLGYNDEEGGGRTWVLYNSDDEDHFEPVNPPKEDPKDEDDEKIVLRPEAGAYVGASQSWAKMHMRLHDRFGQAYYIDPFDGEEKPAAAWVRQVGSHSHFRMAGGQSKTHSNTAVTQIGGDLLRNEFNEDWKYIGGVFAGGLYNRSDSRSWDSAKSRTDGYSLGIYGTLYTGNSPDDGFYVDSWLLFGRYDNKIWSDEISSFKFKSHGWVWSVETGYTIPIGESGTKDYNELIWTFQPEAQLVWDGVKANSATDSFGTKYRQLGTDNVTLRVGARLHANYMNKGLGFIEGNWIHNSKKAGVQMGTDKVYMDGGRNLGEFRMGLEGHLSRNTLGWATVGVQAGKSGYHNETAQIGIKYMF